MPSENTPSKVSKLDTKAIQRQAAEQERDRVRAIEDLFADCLDITGADTLRREAINEGLEVAEATAALNDLLRKQLSRKSPTAPPAEPLGDDAPTSGTVSAGQDAREKLQAAMELNILARSGRADKETREAARKSEFTSFDLMGFCRRSLELRGISYAGMNKSQIVGLAIQRDGGGLGTSDLTAVVANIANKMMMQGYETDKGSWRAFSQIGNLNDFRQTSRVNLGTIGKFEEKAEDGSYRRGYLSDYNETLQAKSYGKELLFTRELIINDDVSALVRIPLKFGEKAEQRVSEFVIAMILSNPTLNADATAVYHTDHGNITTVGGAPSVATLGVARNQMRQQKEQESKAGLDDGDFLNVAPAYLLVPTALETTSQVLIASQYDPASTTNSRAPNPFMNQMQVLAEPRLDATSATGWYTFASPDRAPTIEVAFIGGNDAPFIDQMEDWHTDGLLMKGRIEFDATFLDFRGTTYNDGTP